MTDKTTESKYILEWKSKQAGLEGKSGLYHIKEIEQQIFTLKEKYPDLEHWITSIN